MKKNQNKLFKHISNLTAEYQVYLKKKNLLMNHHKSIEYMFNKPGIKTNKLSDLLQIDYKYPLKNVILESNISDNLIDHWTDMLISLEIYNAEHTSYLSTIDQMKKHGYTLDKLPKIDFLSVTSNFNEMQTTVYQVLDRLESINKNKQVKKKVDLEAEINHKVWNKLNYVYQWSFHIENSHTSSIQLPKVNYMTTLTYDFYGQMIISGRMIQFVILCDDNSHYDPKSKDFVKTHILDIMKQYILWSMSIHLLRIKKHMNTKKELVRFLKKIRSANAYVSQNQIKPIKEIIDKPYQLQELINFTTDYKFNHVIYLKRKPTQSNVVREIEDGEEDFGDEGKLVTTDAIEKILQDKEDFKSIPKKKNDERVANLMVTLIGHHKEMEEPVKKLTIDQILEYNDEKTQECIKELLNGHKK